MLCHKQPQSMGYGAELAAFAFYPILLSLQPESRPEACTPGTLTVRVDKGELIRWPHKEPVLIEGLHLQESPCGVHIRRQANPISPVQNLPKKIMQSSAFTLMAMRGAVGKQGDCPLVQGENSGLLANIAISAVMSPKKTKIMVQVLFTVVWVFAIATSAHDQVEHTSFRHS